MLGPDLTGPAYLAVGQLSLQLRHLLPQLLQLLLAGLHLLPLLPLLLLPLLLQPLDDSLLANRRKGKDEEAGGKKKRGPDVT